MSDAPTIVVDIDQIVPTYTSREDNPNKMPPEKFELLKSAIHEHGFLQPVLVVPIGVKDGRTIYKLTDGHHRYWALLEMEAATIEIKLSKEKDDVKQAGLGLAMNRLRGDVNLKQAAEVLQLVADTHKELDIEDLSVLTGFTGPEISTMLKKAEVEDVSDILGGGGVDLGEDDKTASPKPFMLEIEAPDRDAYKMAKRRLKKAAGKGGSLWDGLIAVLGEKES